MAVGRVWDADNGVWQRIGGPPNVVDPTEPASPVDGLIWTNPTDGISQIWDETNDEWIILGTGAGGGHIVDTVEPVAPEDGLLWTNPAEINVADPSRLPKGVLGYAQVTANQGSLAGTMTDLTGLAVTVTVAASRRIKITGQVFSWGGGAAGEELDFNIREGSTLLNRIRWKQQATGNDGGGSVIHIATPTAGSHTYKLSFLRTSGAGTYNTNATATEPAFILVEDIGAA